MKNQSSITRFHLESLYRIMLKRIGKGYSTRDLSFLIGRETDYINQVEMLMVPLYSEDELQYIAGALEEDEAANLLLNADDHILLTVAVECEQQEQTLTRAYYEVNAEDDRKLLFMLKEEVLEDFDDDSAEAACLDSVRCLLEALLGSGYFHQNRNALEIFETLRPLTAFELRPSFVDWALDDLSDEENTERMLEKSVSNEICYGYEAC